MKEFIEFIVKHLVDNPESVVIEEKSTEDNRVLFSLRVAAGDIGKVIGRQGKTAQAMRTLLTAASAKVGQKAVLEILD